VNKNKTPSAAEANRAYFTALANTRASLASLPGVTILVILLLSLDTFAGIQALVLHEGAGLFLPLFTVHLTVLGMCGFVLILTVSKRAVFRFQTLFSVVMASMSALLVYSISIMAVVISSFDSATSRLSPAMFYVIGAAALVLTGGASGFHALLLRRRLRLGHSENRTVGNYLAVSRSNTSKIYWATFGLVMIIPNVLTQGQYLVNCIGIIMLIVFACFTTSLPVEFAYLAYLKSKDRDYWERPPRPVAKEVRLRLARKIVVWVVGVTGALALFWVLAKYVL
jgi:hypothetical protein